MKRILSLILFLPLMQQKEELKTKGVYYFKPLSELWRYKYVDPLVSTYYMSPSGNNANAGTIGSPWHDFDVLTSAGLAAGDIVYVRGGTYRCSKSAATGTRFGFNGLNGSAGNMIKIWNYPGESPVFNYDDILCTAGGVVGLAMDNCTYTHVKGIRLTGLYQNGSSPNSLWQFILGNCSNCTIEQCEVDNGAMYGMTNGNCHDILWLNCDVHHLSDPYTTPPNGGSTGFVAGQNGSTSYNITWRGCRAWNIGDNGFMDFRITGTDGALFFENCWSFWNGYSDNGVTTYAFGDDIGSGWKLGVTAQDNSTNLRTMTNCIAAQNKFWGFTQNTGRCGMTLYNCIAYDNRWYGYFMGYNNEVHTAKNNIDYANANPAAFTTESTISNNSWNGFTVTSGDFESLDVTQLDNARQSDGSLPIITAFHLASGSDLIDGGVNVGLPFNNAAPDMGAFETGGSTPPVLNTIKVVRRPKRIE